MPTRPLPNDPSLEHLRKEAKRLLKAIRAGDADALARVAEFHPRAAQSTRFLLSDAQLVTARTYGFASWRALRDYFVRIEPFVWHTPGGPPDPRSLADVFIRLACLAYGDWHRSNPAKAHRLLAEHPDVASANIYAACAAGDVTAVKAMVDRDPSLVNVKGGPLHWEPLLYACYSRIDVPGRSTLDLARVLLERGADPNAGFMWGGTYVFTALTGAFGEGEDSINEPPHPERDALAKLLLDAGADPNDGQTLYNRHFREDDGHLTLLLAYGLGRETGGPWRRRLGERAASPQRLLVEELRFAAVHGFFARAKLLVEHGVDVNTPSERDGRTPYEVAIREGHDRIAAYLLEHGARKVEIDRPERFSIAAAAGRLDDARALLDEDPSILERLGHAGRADLLHRAVDANRPDAIRFLVGLGIDVNGIVPNTGLDRAVLHNAAAGGNVALVELLLELGADPQLRDATYHATPLGWADHFDQSATVEYLMRFADIFDAVRCGGVERAANLLRENGSLANAADDSGNPLIFYVHAELKRLDEMLPLLLRHGCDINARNAQGRTRLDAALARGWIDFANVLRAHGAKTG